MRKPVTIILSILLWVLCLPGIESPDNFLGFKLGSDRKLAHYDQIKKYFIRVGNESPRVETVIIGKTTLNNDMILAVVSSENNMKNLDQYRSIARKMTLAEVSDEEAEKLANNGKAIVFITCNLHSTEIGSSQMAMELLFNLATENTPEVKDILEKVILVLVPTVNPDGQIMVVDYYKKYLGTKYEGGSMPYLYHHYAGHDNNRDWFRLSLKESQLVTHELYHKWFPQILVDEHQMGSSGDRFFIPPFQDPPSPDIHPLVWRGVNLIGARIAYDLEMLGYPGVASRGYFTGWWIGALDDTGWFHNIPGILFEAASVRIATPIFVEKEEVRSGESRSNEVRIFSPHPWQGGWWRLRDIINYDLYATLSVLKTAAINRKEFLLNSFYTAKENIKKGRSETPFAYIIPRDQWDPLVAEKLVSILLKSNIKVYQLTQPIKTKQQWFDSGDYIIPLAQPYRSFVKNIFSKQHYPDLRRDPKEKPILPYDMAAWTLPLGMGVTVHMLDDPIKPEMKSVNMADVSFRNFPQKIDKYVILDARYNNSYMAAAILLQKGIDVYRNVGWEKFPKGSFLAEKSASEKILRQINDKNPILITSQNQVPLEKFKKLKNFRVGLFQNWGHNMTEGWTRYVFDEFRINYKTLHPRDFQKKDISKKYDVLVFVGASESQIESGKPPKEWERWMTPLPPEYTGGIGKQGEKTLKNFLKTGKALVFMGRSCKYAIKKFRLPISNAIEKKPQVVCPGSYLKALVKESPLTAGMNNIAAIFFRRNPVFATSMPRSVSETRRTPVVFPERNLLLSGWLEGEKFLRRKSLVVDYQKDGGRIILIGPDIIHRSHCEGTYKIMFNALFLGAETSDK